jgi:hypothetical protein
VSRADGGEAFTHASPLGSLQREPRVDHIDANRYLKNTPLRSWPITAPTTFDGLAGSEVN